LGILIALGSAGHLCAQSVPPPSYRGAAPFDGVTLVSSTRSTTTFTMDLDGNTLQTWQGAARPGSIAYLLPGGSLLRPCRVANGGPFGANGGRIQRFDPQGNLDWDFFFSTTEHQQHHDVVVMPNGNVLLIAYERKTRQEAVDAGRLNINTDMWPDMIAEIQPEGFDGGNIVWEWHVWDHIIQDVDPEKPDFGVIADHPELFDINVGGVSANGDWTHVNAVDYNADLDQISFSSPKFNEFFVIDHSTTTEEAAGHAGGRSNMGGDLLYRWGNPQTYQRGTADDQVFFIIHGVNWIDCGMPGGGHILAFNNGNRPGENNDYSTALEIVPPLTMDGTYAIDPGKPFGPAEPTWSYGGPGDFYGGPTQCGAFRLPNGNTLISEAQAGHTFEVTEAGETVWDFVHPSSVARVPRYQAYGLENVAAFFDCLTGPGGDATGCQRHDHDCDGDVDLADFARIQRLFGQFVGP